MSKPHILIGTPCYGGVLHIGYFRSMMRLQELCTQQGIGLTFHNIGSESLVQRARNWYVSIMLSNPVYTHLVFIDADITFEAENVLKWIHDDSKDVVCGIYPKKALQWNNILEIPTLPIDGNISSDMIEQISNEYVINFPLDTTSIQPVNGYVKCLYAGTGMMCIKRNVIELLKERYPETKYVNDVPGYVFEPTMENNFYALFDCFICPTSNRYLSEDFAFCQRVIDQGFDIWADLTCDLNHTGNHTFKGSFGKKMVFLHQKSIFEIEKAKQAKK